MPADLVSRGNYTPSTLGTLTFVGLRAADPAWQHSLIFSSVGATVLSKLPSGGAPSFSDVPLVPGATMVALSALGATKQIYWALGIAKETMPAGIAATVAAYNTVLNSANSLLFLCPRTSSLTVTEFNPLVPYLDLPLNIVLGSALCVFGLGMETLAERQRKKFKETKGNEGKVCRVGLWGKARQPNYGGYVIWRFGAAMAASGWVAGAVVGGWHLVDFVTRAIPAMDEYCGRRYGDEWKKFTEEVTCRLIPGVF